MDQRNDITTDLTAAAILKHKHNLIFNNIYYVLLSMTLRIFKPQ